MPNSSKRVDDSAALLLELSAFGREHDQGCCFQGWDDDTLAGYFSFHARHGTLAYVRDPEGDVVGLGVAWQLHEPELAGWKTGGNQKHAFHWQATDPRGDSVLIAEVVAVTRDAVAALAAEYQWRFPNWRRLKTFTFRRGKLKQYHRPEELVRRMEAYAL